MNTTIDGKWLSQKDLSKLLNPADPDKEYAAVRQRTKRGKYPSAKKINHPESGKPVVYISIDDPGIPGEVKLRWVNEAAAVIPSDKKDEPVKEQAVKSLTKKEEEIALARASFVNLFIDAGDKAGSVIENKKKFIRAYNNGALEKLFALLGRVTFVTAERWKKTYLDNGKDYTALARNYKKKSPSVTAEESKILLKLALKPNRPLISEVVRGAIEIFETNHYPNIKTPITYRRWLKDWKAKHYANWVALREGEKALNDKCLPSVTRDYDKIDVGDVLVADGHVLNFEIINPYTGKPKRMTMILFYDMKSNMPLGHEIMPSENVQAIAVALRRAILFLGKIPKVVYLDNGKAFAAKYFNGTDLRQTQIPGLFAKLGIKVIHAMPYHGQSKTIERFFRTFAELERMMPTYVGTSIEMQPARMNRGEKIFQSLYNKMVDVDAFTIYSAHQAVTWWFEKYANRIQQSGHLKGLKPMEVFEAGRGPGIDKAELTYLMMSEEIKTISKDGFRFNTTWYYSEALFGLKKEIMIRYDLIDKDCVYCFDKDTGDFICEAWVQEKAHPAAGILGTEEDVEKLTGLLKRRERLRTTVVGEIREFNKQIVVPETSKQLAAANILSLDDPIKQEPKKVERKKVQKKKMDEEIIRSRRVHMPEQKEEDDIQLFNLKKRAIG